MWKSSSVAKWNYFRIVGLYEPLYDNVPCKPPEGTTVCRSSFLKSFDTCFSYPFFSPHSIFPSQCSRDTNLRPCFSILSFISRVWLVRVEMFRAYDLALDTGHRKSEGWMLVLSAVSQCMCTVPKRRHLLTGSLPPVSGSGTGPDYEEM